jgi:hypothetical protein
MTIKLEPTPDQVFDWVSALGCADSVLRDLAEKPDTNGLFKLMLRNFASSLREIQAEITTQHNEQVKG